MTGLSIHLLARALSRATRMEADFTSFPSYRTWQDASGKWHGKHLDYRARQRRAERQKHRIYAALCAKSDEYDALKAQAALAARADREKED